MVFLDDSHIEEIQQLETLWKNLANLSHFARERGVEDIFQDNGAKVVQQMVYLYLNNLAGREGNDATSREDPSIEWEMKSINIDTTAQGFSTHHHLNYEILNKYREVPWSFAIYRGIELQSIYILNPEDLEDYFLRWQGKLDNGAESLNNPKISVKNVRKRGRQVYPINYDNPINPYDVVMGD